MSVVFGDKYTIWQLSNSAYLSHISSGVRISVFCDGFFLLFDEKFNARPSNCIIKIIEKPFALNWFPNEKKETKLFHFDCLSRLFFASSIASSKFLLWKNRNILAVNWFTIENIVFRCSLSLSVYLPEMIYV